MSETPETTTAPQTVPPPEEIPAQEAPSPVLSPPETEAAPAEEKPYSFTVEDLPGSRKKVLVTVLHSAVAKMYDQEFQSFRKDMDIPGFRRGKAPMPLIRARYASVVKPKVISALMEKFLPAVLEESKLQPIGEPELGDISLEPDKDFTCFFSLDVLPGLEGANYTGLELTRTVEPITAEIIEDFITHALKENAEYEPVEGEAAEKGFYVTFILSGEVENETLFEGMPRSFSGIIGELNCPGKEPVEDGLVGMKEGESKSLETQVRFLDRTEGKLYQGQAKLTLKLLELKRVIIPEADDEFARSLNLGYENFEDYRAKVTTQLENKAKEVAEHNLRTEAVKKLIEINPFEIPELVISKQLEENELYPYFNEEGKAKAREEAEFQAKRYLLLKKVSDLEKIEAKDVDVDAEIQAMAAQAGKDTLEYRVELEKNNKIDDFKEAIRERETVKFLVEKAVFPEKTAEKAETTEE